MLFHGWSIMRSPVRELCKRAARIQPLSLTQLSDRLWHGRQMCRVLAAIHKHDLLVILVSSLLLVFVSCGLWCARPSVYVWETAAEGPPISVFRRSLSPLSDCQRVSCYSAWTQQCSKQRRGSAQPWHFCGISAAPRGRQTQPSAVGKLVLAISGAHERQWAPGSTVTQSLNAGLFSVSLGFWCVCLFVCVCVLQWTFLKTSLTSVDNF